MNLSGILRYSKASGLFYEAGTNRIRHGHILNGYRAFKIRGKIYYAHRLAWFLVTGKWPKEIDHRNGARWDNRWRRDNRWRNLREVTRQQNCFNRKAHGRYGKGVMYINDRFRRKPFAAKIVVNGESRYLGYFSTPHEANQAYKKASQKYHGAHGRSA